MLKLIYGNQEIIKPGRLQRRKLGKNSRSEYGNYDMFDLSYCKNRNIKKYIEC